MTELNWASPMFMLIFRKHSLPLAAKEKIEILDAEGVDVEEIFSNNSLPFTISSSNFPFIRHL